MNFEKRFQQIVAEHNKLVHRDNSVVLPGNGIFERYKYPVLTADHVPISWRYDLSEQTNPYLMTRFGINAVFNAGAIKWQGKYLVVARVEGWDRKSFFALAESDNGVDNFRFRDSPVAIAET